MTYRGHAVVLTRENGFTAHISEQSSLSPFPTSVWASEIEGKEVCYARARALIDLYLDQAT